MTLTSSPIGALNGTLMVGCEREPDRTLRLYVEARYRGLFLRLPAGDAADEAERLWERASSHLFITPAPFTEAIFSDAEEGRLAA